MTYQDKRVQSIIDLCKKSSNLEFIIKVPLPTWIADPKYIQVWTNEVSKLVYYAQELLNLPTLVRTFPQDKELNNLYNEVVELIQRIAQIHDFLVRKKLEESKFLQRDIEKIMHETQEVNLPKLKG